MKNPKTGEIWHLKSDPTKTLKIEYLNSCDFVGFSGAAHMVRAYGTKKLSAFLRSYMRAV